MADKTPEEIIKDFKRLQSLAIALGKDLNKFNLNPVAKDAALIGELLGKWSDELENTAASAVDIASGFKSVVQEISKGNVGLSATKKTFNGLTSIAQKLSYEQAGINKLTLKELKAQKEKAKQAKADAEIANNALQLRKKALIDENKSGNISLTQKKKNREEIKTITASISENNAIINEQSTQYKDLLSTLDARIESETQINELMGLGGAAVEAVGGALDKLGMGGLKKALGLDEVSNKMREIAEEIEEAGGNTDSFANKFKVLKGGIKEAGSQLVSNLKDPLAITSFLTTQIIDALMSVDKQAGDLAKNFGISYDAALRLKSELTSAANQSFLLNITSQGLVESFTTLNNLFGTFAEINEQALEDFTRLTKEAFLSNEAASALYKTTILTGKGLEDSTKEFAGQAKALAMQKGLALNQKQILESIKDISTATLLQLQGQPEALAEAVVNAKALGVSLDQVENIAQSLLDFESSIANELEAELLTGKQLNLERARLAALNGDIATVAEEIANQIGDAADFTKMNVIQQEALAKSVGMTREDLAKSLMEREAMAKLSDQEGKTAQERFNNLVKEVGMEEAKRRLGDETMANLYSQQNVQERFNASVEKLKDIFVSIAEPILKIVNPLMDLGEKVIPALSIALQPFITGFEFVGSLISHTIDLVTKFKPLLVALGLALAPMAINALVTATGMIMSAFSVIPVVGPFLGAAFAAGTFVGLIKTVKGLVTGDDVISPGYGKRTLLMDEGAIALNDKDTVIAGTNLGGSGRSNASPQTVDTITKSQANEMISLLNKIANKDTNISMDSRKLNSALMTSGVSYTS